MVVNGIEQEMAMRLNTVTVAPERGIFWDKDVASAIHSEQMAKHLSRVHFGVKRAQPRKPDSAKMSVISDVSRVTSASLGGKSYTSRNSDSCSVPETSSRSATTGHNPLKVMPPVFLLR